MKKLNRLSAIIALILIAAFILPSTAVIAAANDSNLVYFYGDLNANGEIDKFDYILIKRSCMNTFSLTDEQISRGDINNNGEIDKLDYILVKRHVMGTFTIPKVTLCEHELESINAKDATCDENGNIAYFYCVKCEKCYSDADATNEITPESTVISAKGHDYTESKNDENGSWKECACGEKSETIAHTYTDVITPPTDSEQGFTTHTCNECGRSYADSYVTASVGLAYTVNNDGITCTVTGKGRCMDTELIIPSEINGYKVTSIGEEAFDECRSLTSITIPDSVTSIGNYAFINCTNLESVYYQGNVEDWILIDFGGYYSNPCHYAENLYFNDVLVTELVIPDGVTSIGSYAFYNCDSLTSINIPDSVASIGNYAFYKCTGLTSVTIGNGVTSIGDSAFRSCKSLTSITIPDSVTSIGDTAFADCNYLTSVTIGNSVTSIGDDAFRYCSKLTSITIPDSVTSIGDYAFNNCYSLTSVTIGNGVTLIGDHAFDGCTDLKSVYYQGNVENWPSIQFESYASNPCCKGANLYFNEVLVTELVIPDGVTSIGDFAFYNCDSLTSITIPDSVTSIGDFAFYKCTSLTSITIGNSVTSIGDKVFYGCSSLKYNVYDNAYYLGNANNPYVVLVQAISEYITSCTINSNTKCIYSSAFLYCDNLRSITIPDSVTSIGDYAFSGCDSLKYNVYDNAYYLGNANNPYVVLVKAIDTNIASCIINPNTKYIHSDAFYMCTSLTSITIPDSVTSIGNYAFACCDNLRSITIPDSVTSIGGYAFRYCSKLTSITIPDSVTSIGYSAFEGCTNLKDVYYAGSQDEWKQIEIGHSGNDVLTSATIHYNCKTTLDGWIYSANKDATTCAIEGIGTYADAIVIPPEIDGYKVTTIGYKAFYNCDSLTSITIPDSVTSIGEWAFYDCDSLKDVYYAGSRDEWKQIKIGYCNDVLTSATIHYNSK